MTRAFTTQPVDAADVDHVVGMARRAPSAGNTASTSFLVLEGPEQVATYWDTTLPIPKRATFPWPTLLHAPVLVVPFVDPSAYTARYSEADKVHTGLGVEQEAWTTPYWWVDGGMASMVLLLAVEDIGLGALFFGLFEHENAVKERFGVPPQLRAVGAIAIGHSEAVQRQSMSAARESVPLQVVLHRGCW